VKFEPKSVTPVSQAVIPWLNSYLLLLLLHWMTGRIWCDSQRRSPFPAEAYRPLNTTGHAHIHALKMFKVPGCDFAWSASLPQSKFTWGYDPAIPLPPLSYSSFLYTITLTLCFDPPLFCILMSVRGLQKLAYWVFWFGLSQSVSLGRGPPLFEVYQRSHRIHLRQLLRT